VHTTTLRSDAFALTIDGRPAAIPDLFPGFDEHDRLGIVISADHGAAGAGTLVLVVPPEPEEILRAINDRGVTRLLVPDAAPEPHVAAALNPDTRASAERRLRSALAYSSSGNTTGADVVVRGSSQSDAYIHAMLATTGGSPDAAQGTESFRRLEIPTALGMLAAVPG
jgi:hypothetical protein